MMYRLLRSALFAFDAETIHHAIMTLVRVALRLEPVRRLVRSRLHVSSPALVQTLWGLRFENPVGLAAGFDKNARYLRELDALGFGFIEIGTITGQAQAGNDRPRLFRLPKAAALLNRMGFNNEGSQAVAKRLAETTPPDGLLLGVNIGKTKVVALEDATADYALSLERLLPFADYLVVNVSSPNTPGLRQLQDKAPLMALLTTLKAHNQRLSAQADRPAPPLLLKIAPDLEPGQLDDIIDVVTQVGVDGVIATNTTISRQGLDEQQVASLGAGGISGRPVHERAVEVVRYLRQRLPDQVHIIGVGGVFHGEDALRMFEAGASLIQVWTGFVYEGPLMVRRINRELERALKARGLEHISALRAAGADL